MEFRKGMLVYNGNAGQKNIEKSLAACVPILSAELDSLVLLPTKREGHARELCREYGSEVDVVFILGGDGTVHECINGLAPLETRPAIGILPGGTCNDFSRTLNIPQNIRNAALSMVAGEMKPVDVMQANEDYFLNFWGIGLVAEASENIKATEKKLFGRISYFLSTLRTIKEMEPFHASLIVDGTEIEEDAVMILLANGHYIGTNELPFRNLDYNDGLADIFIVKDANLALMKEALTEDSIEDNENILHYKGKEIQVRADKRMEADMDGEVYSATPCQIRVHQAHVQMIKPGQL
ncbi:YegS/Rv2252/BmrU family lipid kinase [Bacillus infantis]|uniref:diacylglycerol/lipid kinase family protein n=1 Tax=Bacillus infantis TaxID=324767 RepID=UPI001CD3473B|nr:YegS/Rv2252/BmrU family lipid kinase [Bacillus infantis]MCA1041695.1 YegS/Rv2252/BmrU family lipid kinase [Bacillus infantis]